MNDDELSICLIGFHDAVGHSHCTVRALPRVVVEAHVEVERAPAVDVQREAAARLRDGRVPADAVRGGRMSALRPSGSRVVGAVVGNV